MTANATIDAVTMIQLIEKQDSNYRLIINGTSCLFIPMNLFLHDLLPVKKCQVNGSIGWYVNREFISYNKIKKAILCNR